LKKLRELSTIEMTVLGMAYLRGPCSIYAIYKELSSSASTYHKSRAGTAYSVSKRLLGFGLIEPAEGDAVRISAAGEQALRDWIGPPIPMVDVAHTVDKLRLRFFFLGALNPDARLKFIDSSIEALEVFERRAIDLIAKNEEIGDYFGSLATVSLVLETRARISWLRLVRGWVEHPIGPGNSWAEEIVATLLSESSPQWTKQALSKK
jgi:DNA-binding PadR family transcriptional regulator